jgi:hypothetical protein
MSLLSLIIIGLTMFSLVLLGLYLALIYDGQHEQPCLYILFIFLITMVIMLTFI